MTSNQATPPDSASVELTNQRADIERLVQDVLAALTRHGFPEAGKFAIRLAIEEAVSNAFHHGHKNLAPDVPITVSYKITPAQAEVSVQDRGPGFDPGDVPDPTLDENIEVPSGRGLLLMRAYMAEITYIPPGNRVRMVYRKPRS